MNADVEQREPKMTRKVPLHVLLYQDAQEDGKSCECNCADSACRITGPFHRLDDVLDAAERHDFDVAVVSLGRIAPSALAVADALAERNLPVVVIADYGLLGLPAHFSDHPVVARHSASLSLAEAIDSALAGR
jgi:hypothetical protein